MNLLGFGNGGLSDSLFLPRSKVDSNKLCAFAAGSYFHITHIVFSCSFFNHGQSGRDSFHRQEIKAWNTTLPYACGRDMHAHHALKFLGGIQFSLASLGTSFIWSKGSNNNKTNKDEGSKTTMAFFGRSNNNLNGRFWTNVLIGLNVLIFVAQEASHGKLLLLGAKVNSLIDRGQLWRFLTPAFLHASLPHLVTNCYSLHSIGPVIEAQGGAARFLSVYFGSAITGFILSYSFTRAPAIGASGAVFGLVGSLAVFLLRHRDLLTGAQQSLSNLSRMIAINMVLGLATSKIDNWGHLGGLVGGAAISWLVGPAFSYKRIAGEQKRVLVDRPPVSYLLPQNWKDGL
ncbi:hypothetical protein L7F22_003421 [Adiantum nelumboides]|nr:hypothetical protein [Adiantum nelumboides]